MSLMNLPMAARPVSGAMLGRRLTPSSAHMEMMAGLSMRRCALMNFSLKSRISALGSAGGAGVCGEGCRRKKTEARIRKVEQHAESMEYLLKASHIGIGRKMEAIRSCVLPG